MDLALLIEALIFEGVKKPPLPAGWKMISQHLQPEEKDKLRSNVVKGIVDIFKKLPKDDEFQAAAKAGEAKRGWYASSARAIQDLFGVDTPRFVALLASMSPQVSVEENMRNAIRIWRGWVQAGRPHDEDAIQVVGRKAIGKSRWDGMRAWSKNATASLATQEPEKLILGGQKVDSFRRNLLGDLSAVTNDAWMANFGEIDQELFGTQTGYLAYTAKVRKVAAQMGWKPAEVQETVWSFFKALYEKSHINSPATTTVHHLSDTDIDTVPDFAKQMLKDPHVRKELDALGLGAGRGSPDEDVRPGSGTNPSARAAEGGLVGAVGRVAKRAEFLQRRRDTDEFINNNVYLASARVVSNRAGTVTLSLDPADMAKLKRDLGQRNFNLNKGNLRNNENYMKGVIIPRGKRWLILNRVEIIQATDSRVKLSYTGSRNFIPHEKTVQDRIVTPTEPTEPAMEPHQTVPADDQDDLYPPPF